MLNTIVVVPSVRPSFAGYASKDLAQACESPSWVRTFNSALDVDTSPMEDVTFIGEFIMDRYEETLIK